MRMTILALVMTGMLLAVPAAADATYDPVDSGQTKLRLDTSFLALLGKNGVKLEGLEGVQLKGGTVTFPIAGGKYDPTIAKGYFEHLGALVFKKGGQKVKLTGLQLKTTRRHAPFSAKFGGGQLKMATTAKLAVTRQGFGEEVRASTLKLSAKVATRLDKKLRLRGVFKVGQPLGTAMTKANPLTVALKRAGMASLVIDPGFQAKLNDLFVAVNPIFPAEHSGPFTLPIAGGSLAPDATTGRIDLSGALELLQLGGGQVFWREPFLDFGDRSLDAEVGVDPAPPYGGKLGALQIGVFSGGNISAEAKARTITASSLVLDLNTQMAAIFDEVFAKPQGGSDVFSAGEAVGTLSFSVHGQ